MIRILYGVLGVLLASLLALPSAVQAQEPADVDEDFEPGRFQDATDMPEPRVVELAGDSARPYGSAGVLELGGWASISSARDFTLININPQVGWFVYDNVKLSAILGLRAIRQGDERDTYFSALVEPAFHLAITEYMMGFFGAGVGPSWSRDDAFGLAVQPRVGANFLIGRSGVFTPAVFALYSTTGMVREVNGGLLGVDLLWGISAGYTVMW